MLLSEFDPAAKFREVIYPYRKLNRVLTDTGMRKHAITRSEKFTFKNDYKLYLSCYILCYAAARTLQDYYQRINTVTTENFLSN